MGVIWLTTGVFVGMLINAVDGDNAESYRIETLSSVESLRILSFSGN